ncbi:HalOD1 output domain-containing protein [Haloferax sp. DFSO52]|uniref:HalOD1 output domain-containing protein n=1 Tax=Haloferax sp. DFSO52 TaxID=3388505 RepID=UPI003A88DF34
MDDQLDEHAGSVVTISADRYDEVAVAITSAVATATELSPLELPPLADIGVDPEALDALFQPSRDASRHIRFHYAGFLVSLFGDGTVTVAKGED